MQMILQILVHPQPAKYIPIVNDMELLSQRRLDIVIASAIGIALVLFCIVAVEGYKTFGSFVREDILLNYPENSQVTFLRICIAIMLALHYPLQLDPSRRCITSWVNVVMQWWETHPNDDFKISTKVFNRKQSSGMQTEMGGDYNISRCKRRNNNK